MVSLALILVVVAVTLAVLLFVGGLFLQGYIYTQPASGLAWRAPVAGLIITGLLALWCWLDATDSRSIAGYRPYDTLFLFSPDLKLVNEPVKKFWTIRKGEKQEYISFKIPQGPGNVITQYYLTGKTGLKGPIWNAAGAEEIIIEHNGKAYHFKPRKAEDNDYPTYVNDEGWVMTQYDTGVTGLPRMFNTGLFFANLLLNFLHLGLWFGCLWVLLRFQWSHALVLAVIIWLVMTLFVLPPLLSQAVEVVQTS